MAVLKTDDLSVKVVFTQFINGWVFYNFYFLHNDLPIFNKALRDEDYFFANDSTEDTLRQKIEKLLQSNSYQEWEPEEPDIRIEMKAWGKEHEVKEDDYFELTFVINSAQLKGPTQGVYSADGPAFRIVATRIEMNEFLSELYKEWALIPAT